VLKNAASGATAMPLGVPDQESLLGENALAFAEKP
jgi:hypothetical protein